jgi:hypothetical protein
MKKQVLIIALFLLGLFISMSLAVEFTLLGPKKYLRTTGKPDVYNDTFLGTVALGKLILTNGTSDGKNRVSSASIFINGQQILGPSDFNQQVYNLEVPINLTTNNTICVKLASKPGSYITVKIIEEVPADATASEVIDPQGGIVSVQNHLGDRMTLEIPPLALAVSPPNPICTNIFPGVVLEPSSTIFSLPAKIKVEFHDALSNPNTAMLFWLKNSNCVVPIGNNAGTQNGIEGETTHFSPIIVGAPTADEIFMQIAEIIVRGGDTSALGILETIDDYYAMMRFAEQLRILGEDQKAAEAENSARGLLQERTLQLLSSPPPANPCGQYSNALTKLSDLVVSALSDTSLAALVAARSCTLTITPSAPNLRPGDTAVLTAVLTDPTASQHTCSSLPWYSSDLDVVQIALIAGTSCTIKAGIGGTANISANCDGLLGSAKVTVSGDITKWQLTWRKEFHYDESYGPEETFGSNDICSWGTWTHYIQIDDLFQGEAVIETTGSGGPGFSKVLSVSATGNLDEIESLIIDCTGCADPHYGGPPGSYIFKGDTSWRPNDQSLGWLQLQLDISRGTDLSYININLAGAIPGYFDTFHSEKTGMTCSGSVNEFTDGPREGPVWYQAPGIIPASDGTGTKYYLKNETWEISIEKIN